MLELLIDVGTTHIKHEVFDPHHLRTVESGKTQSPAPVESTAPRDEVDPHDLLVLIQELVNKHVSSDSSVQAIRLSTQMHSFILTSSEGTPLTPLITWRDARTTENWFQAEVYDSLVQRNGGVWNKYQQLRPGLPVFKIMHLMRECPDLFRNQEVMVHTVGSFIAFHLTHQHFTHETNAAALGLYDIESHQWGGESVDKTLLQQLSLPSVVHETDSVPLASHVDVRMYPDVGDHQAAYRSWPTNLPPPLMISVGTAGIASGSTRLTDIAGHAELRPYFGDSYLLTVTGLPGGRKLEHEDAAAFAQGAREVAHPSQQHLYVTSGAGPVNREVWDALATELHLELVIAEESDASLMGLREMAVDNHLTLHPVEAKG